MSQKTLKKKKAADRRKLSMVENQSIAIPTPHIYSYQQNHHQLTLGNKSIDFDISKDLLRTFIITALALGIQLCLYYFVYAYKN